MNVRCSLHLNRLVKQGGLRLASLACDPAWHAAAILLATHVASHKWAHWRASLQFCADATEVIVQFVDATASRAAVRASQNRSVRFQNMVLSVEHYASGQSEPKAGQAPQSGHAAEDEPAWAAGGDAGGGASTSAAAARAHAGAHASADAAARDAAAGAPGVPPESYSGHVLGSDLHNAINDVHADDAYAADYTEHDADGQWDLQYQQQQQQQQTPPPRVPQQSPQRQQPAPATAPQWHTQQHQSPAHAHAHARSASPQQQQQPAASPPPPRPQAGPHAQVQAHATPPRANGAASSHLFSPHASAQDTGIPNDELHMLFAPPASNFGELGGDALHAAPVHASHASYAAQASQGGLASPGAQTQTQSLFSEPTPPPAGVAESFNASMLQSAPSPSHYSTSRSVGGLPHPHDVASAHRAPRAESFGGSVDAAAAAVHGASQAALADEAFMCPITHEYLQV